MALRCRKGDMAIVLNSSTGREGALIDVLYFVGAKTNPRLPDDDYWAISYRGNSFGPDGYSWVARDAHLLPIRPGDLDETEETDGVMEFSEQ